MAHLFDQVYERRASDSGKWNYFGPDVLPMWVADMDFPSPPAVLQALQARIEHGFFGYGGAAKELSEVVCERLAREQGWAVAPDEIVYLPGLVCGLNVVTRAIGNPGDGVLVNTPVYPPFISAPVNQGRLTQTADMAISRRQGANGQTLLHYEPDLDALQAAVTPETRLFILCNPHNPVGRAYSEAELTAIGEFCLRNNLVLCSDEIHADLLLGDTSHHAVAALNQEFAARSITLLAPSKTYNLPGLGLSLAVIPDPGLRASFQQAAAGIVPHPNVLGYVAALAAYRDCDEWLAQLCAYLTGNREYLLDFFARNFPEIPMTAPEATYLGWLDFNPLGMDGIDHSNPFDFFLEQAKVALGNGEHFGQAGTGFARINFGCPRSLLVEGLERMGNALTELQRA